VQREWNPQAFPGDGDQQIGRHGDPYLTFHRVLRTAKELVNPKMLFDPLEEQLDLPATAVKIADCLCFDLEVVGQKDLRLASLRVFQANSSHRPGVALSRIEPGQHNFLVADQPNRLVDRLGTDPFDLQGLFGTGYEECASLVDGKQPPEIDIGSLHDGERTGLGTEQIQNVDIVQKAVGNQHKRWDCASEIEQGVNLYGGLGLSIIVPREQRQAQADGSGIEGVDSPIEIQIESTALRVKIKQNREQIK